MIPAHLRRNDPTLTADLAAYRLSPNKAERQEKMLTTNSELAEMKQLHAALMETPTQGTKRVNVVMARDVAPPSKVARLTGILLAEAQAVNPAYHAIHVWHSKIRVHLQEMGFDANKSLDFAVAQGAIFRSRNYQLLSITPFVAPPTTTAKRAAPKRAASKPKEAAVGRLSAQEKALIRAIRGGVKV